jgi:hypothetical protein
VIEVELAKSIDFEDSVAKALSDACYNTGEDDVTVALTYPGNCGEAVFAALNCLQSAGSEIRDGKVVQEFKFTWMPNRMEITLGRP